MSVPSEGNRQDFKIRDLLSDPRDIELFDRGSITAEHYEPVLERRGSFADEVLVRVEAIRTEGLDPAVLEDPAFLLGVISTVSARRESMNHAELVASARGWEGSE